MDYVERIARAIVRNNWPNQVEQTDEMLAGCIVAARDALDAIAATGCKVVERDPTWKMRVWVEPAAFGCAFDAAAAYPGAADEV